MPTQSDIGKFTANTRVLLSFGSAAGGFEFAMQLRKNIMDQYKKDFTKDLDFVYLDAESLKADQSSEYTWDKDKGIFMMKNSAWAAYYQGAMEKCDYLVFLITEPWLKSKWCWQEFNWFSKFVTTKSVTAVYVIFPDARNILDYSKKVTDKDGNQQSLDGIWQSMVGSGNAKRVDINSSPEIGPGKVIVDGQTYTYDHNYVCNATELAAILKEIRILPK